MATRVAPESDRLAQIAYQKAGESAFLAIPWWSPLDALESNAGQELNLDFRKIEKKSKIEFLRPACLDFRNPDWGNEGTIVTTKNQSN